MRASPACRWSPGFTPCCCRWSRSRSSALPAIWSWPPTRPRPPSSPVRCPSMAAPASEQYVALVGMVALLTAGLSAAGADLQAGVPRRFPLAHGAGRVSHRCRVSGRHRDAGRHVRCHGQLAPHARSGVGNPAGPAAVQSSDIGAVRARGGQHPARQALCPAPAAFTVRGRWDDRGERGVPLRRSRHRGHRSGSRRACRRSGCPT